MTEQDKIEALLELHKFDLPEQEYEQLITLIKIYKLSYEDVEYEIKDILNTVYE